MSHHASTIAAGRREGSDLQFDRKHAAAAIEAAWHLGCSAFEPLRTALVNALRIEGHPATAAKLHADDLIGLAAVAIAGEPHTTPCPGSPQAQKYAQAMHEMETSK
ncbi:hypothetical protein [Nonomuraea bangladeshensis]|uniref:hypothetical protein n=1 Tax=Nonomuraea bangladeshensis TaxID=404385 RepID=UPI0031DCEBEF